MLRVALTKRLYLLFCPLVLAFLFPVIANGQQPTPQRLSIGFGSVQVGVGNSQTETLTNNGGTSIIISDASASGTGFSLSGLSFPVTLNAGKSTSFSVTFDPTSAGFANGIVNITSHTSNGSNPNLSIPLGGTGITLPECSLAKTNNSCRLIIDRSNPVAPSVVQMYSTQSLTVIVLNAKPFERYFLDYQSGQATLSPEVALSIVQGLLPPLGKITEKFDVDLAANRQPEVDQCIAPQLPDFPADLTPLKDSVALTVPRFQNCTAQLSKSAIPIYRQLEPFVAPDSLPKALAEYNKLIDITKSIDAFLTSESGMSGKIAYISGNTILKNNGPDSPALQELSALQKYADAIANDLLGYRQRIADLECPDNTTKECKDRIANQGWKNVNMSKQCNAIGVTSGNGESCVIIESNKDDASVYNGMVTRTITYALNMLNLVAYPQEAVPDPTKKKPLASIAINFADSRPSKVPGVPFSALRWEASAGALFSFLPVRSFSVAPIFSGGQVMDNKVAQNILHPTVVPFAAANYRFYDLPKTRWRSAIYWTGAVGINPNTVSADFASGLSVSWRSLMFSPLWHYGHDVRLTQGFYVGESLGAGFKGTLPTQTYWKSSFALGVSIRVPSLVGR